jgi:hypothetical protein
MYISAINEALDVDHNGTPDVIYYTSDQELEIAKAEIDWSKYAATCATVKVSTDAAATTVQIHSAGGDSKGYYLTWRTQEDSRKTWGNKQYFYPIPSLVMVKNPNIKQNPGWENGATNNGD